MRREFNFMTGRLEPPLPRRPWKKPIGKKWSEFILGRRLNLMEFQEKGVVKVSAYDTQKGRLFYTDPCLLGTRAKGAKVRYRIIVRAKGRERVSSEGRQEHGVLAADRSETRV